MRTSFSPVIYSLQIQHLMKSVGWNERTEESWNTVLKNSDCVCSVWDNDLLVGLGRLVEDGRYGMIYDLAVHPDYQRRGIGKAIAKALIEKSAASAVGLFTDASEPLLKFYASLGFKPVQGMQIRKDEDFRA